VIPDEAVEAALAAQLSFKNQRGMDNSANLMRHILEAAAPHLLREAWEAGCLEGLSYNPGYDDEALAQNPYRKATL
jgi:hypothetical protein